MENELLIPRAVTLDLTEACNLACDYCFTWSKDHKRRTMPLELAKRIIDWWLPQTNPRESAQISFWGGEPLLEWENLKAIVQYSNELAKKLNHVLPEYGGTTNGVLYTPDKVEWCAKNRALFLVSLDGVKAAHDKHRLMPGGKSAWDIIVKNLKEAIKIAPQQRIRTSLSADNVEYFFESIQFFVEELGIHDLAFSPVYEDDWNEETLEKLGEQFDLATAYVIKKAKEGIEVSLKHLNDEATLANDRPIQNPCGAGGTYTGFSVDGFMFPCHRFNKHGLTSEERAKLPTIIARPKGDSFEYCNLEWRKEFVEWKNNAPQKCLDCNIFSNSVCNGGCYAINWDLTGSLYEQAQSVCDFSRVQHEAGQKYKALAEKEGIELKPSSWNEVNNNKNGGRGCTCYNMCYMENTEYEIIHSDNQADLTCTCYNTSYSAPPGIPEQARTLEERRQKNHQVIDALKGVLNTMVPGQVDRAFDILKRLK